MDEPLHDSDEKELVASFTLNIFNGLLITYLKYHIVRHGSLFVLLKRQVKKYCSLIYYEMIRQADKFKRTGCKPAKLIVD